MQIDYTYVLCSAKPKPLEIIDESLTRDEECRDHGKG